MNHVSRLTFLTLKFFLLVVTISYPAFSDQGFDSLIDAKKFKEAIAYAEKNIPPSTRSVDVWLSCAYAYEKLAQDPQKVLHCLRQAQKTGPSNSKPYLELGRFYYKQKKYDESLDNYQKSYVLKRDAASAEGIAMAAAELNQWDKVRDAAESAIKLDENVIQSRLFLYDFYNKEKDYQSAANQLEFIVKKQPNNVTYWKNLAQCYLHLNNKEKLAVIDPKIIQLDKKDIKSRQRYAQYSLMNNDQKTAFTLYKELTVLTPRDPHVFKNLFTIAENEGHTGDAVAFLQRYLQLDSTNADYYRKLGDLLFAQNRYDEASSAYKRALKHNPQISGMYKNYEAIVLKKGLKQEAIEVIENAIKTNEADSKSYRALGDIYKEMKQYAKAITMYQEVLKTELNNVAVLTSLAQCQAAVGEQQASIITYEQVVMMNPYAKDEYKELGDLKMKLGKHHEAIQSYKKYLEKVTDNQEIALDVGMFEYEAKQYKSAVNYLTMVKNPKRHSARYLTALGNSYFNLLEYNKAAEILSKVSQQTNVTQQELKSILLPLAVSYEKIGKTKDAAETYLAYTQLPGTENADASFKKAFLREGYDKNGAIAMYRENIQTFKTDYRNFQRLGYIYAETKKTLSQAASVLNTASTLEPKNSDILIKLGEVYNQLNDVRNELITYQKLLKLEPQNLPANRRVGEILKKEKKYSDAIVNLEVTASLKPDDVEVLTMLAEAYINTNRDKEAINLLVKAKNLKSDISEIGLTLYGLYNKIDQKSAAESEIKELIATTGDNKYRIMYAQDLIQQNRLNEAYDQVIDIKQKEPLNVTVLMLLGTIQQKQNKLDEANETYKMISFITENHAPSMLARGNIYLQQMKLDRANSFFDKALKAEPELALAYLGLAKCAKLRNENTLYLSLLNKAKALDPKNHAILAELDKNK